MHSIFNRKLVQLLPLAFSSLLVIPAVVNAQIVEKGGAGGTVGAAKASKENNIDFVGKGNRIDLFTRDLPPVKIGQIKTPKKVVDIRILGKFLCVLTKNGFLIYDISNPATPLLLVSTPLPYGSESRFSDEPCGSQKLPDLDPPICKFWIATGATLEVLAILTDPDTAPVIPDKALTLTSIPGIAASQSFDSATWINPVPSQAPESLIFQSGFLSPIRVFKLNESQVVEKLGEIDPTGFGGSVGIYDNTIYEAGFSGNALQILSFDPTDISFTTETPFTLPGSANGTLDFDPSAQPRLIVSGTGSSYILDVSTPLVPVLLGTVPTRASEVALSGNRAITTNGNSTNTVIWDVTNPAEPEQVLSIPEVKGDSVLVHQGILHVASTINGLVTYNDLESEDPTIVGTNSLITSSSSDIAPLNSITIVSVGTSRLSVIDVSNPALPNRIGTISSSNISSVAVSGNRAYAGASGTTSLRIFDLTTPTTPTLLGTANVGGTGEDILIEGNFAFMAIGFSGFAIVDISDPASPTIIRSIFPTIIGPNTGYGYSVAKKGNLLAVALGFYLYLYDVTNNNDPTVLSSTLINAEQVEFNGDFLFVASGTKLTVLNVSNPSSPTTVQTVDLADNVTDISLSGDDLFLAVGDAGVQSFSFQIPPPPLSDLLVVH